MWLCGISYLAEYTCVGAYALGLYVFRFFNFTSPLLTSVFGCCARDLDSLTVRDFWSWQHICPNYFHAMRCVTMIYITFTVYLYRLDVYSWIVSDINEEKRDKKKRKSKTRPATQQRGENSIQTAQLRILNSINTIDKSIDISVFDCCHSAHHLCMLCVTLLHGCLLLFRTPRLGRSQFNQSQPMFVQST